MTIERHAAVRRPDAAFVFRHPAHLIAFGGGIGLIPVAPGTFGTLLALPLYAVLGDYIDGYDFLLLIAALFAAGCWACAVTGRALGMADYGGMVWDETVAFLFVLFFTPTTGYWQAFAFLLFRLFDIYKPPPIRYYDQTIKGGFGVMLDDMVAAFYTLLVLAVTKIILY